MHTLKEQFRVMELQQNHKIFKSKLYYIMNKILDNLFYTEKLGIGNKTTLIKNVKERHPLIKRYK